MWERTNTKARLELPGGRLVSFFEFFSCRLILFFHLFSYPRCCGVLRDSITLTYNAPGNENNVAFAFLPLNILCDEKY